MCSNQLGMLLVGALVGVMAGGCSSAKGPKPVPVVGHVLLDGQPLAHAQVVFLPTANPSTSAPRPTAVTDAEGRFRPSTFAQNDGAPEGEYTVLVTYYPLVGPKGQEEAGPNVLPPRYADPQRSPLKAIVAKGTAELEPFQIARK
jgi:hypothetical protein